MAESQLQLTGIHHLTAVTAKAAANHGFYTRTLGLRLVKKTVNQDDVTAYHLFYADGKASPGTDITFFDWPAPREKRGGSSIIATGMRVHGEANLRWWKARLSEAGALVGEVAERDGRLALDFEDPEGQRLTLVDDGGTGPAANPWSGSTVPGERQIRGLGPVVMSVPLHGPTHEVLTGVLSMKRERGYRAASNGAEVHVYRMAGDGPASELHVAVDASAPPARLGAGGVHHVAFRTPNDEEYGRWSDRLTAMGMPTSGPVDRYYFRSLYFREPGGILFEIATDGPGFAADERPEELGRRLALPPFLEPRRKAIEAGLKPLEL